MAAAEGAARGGPPPLVADRIAKTYDGRRQPVPVIADLSLTLEAGSIVSIVGPSGCGKTTLLNVLCGLIPPSAGSVRWYGAPLQGMPDRVGYMLQKDLLFPWRTAITNVMLGIELKGTPRAEARERARALLDQLGLQGFETHYPSTLSGGMRQRTALARTLVNEPEVLLLDEPFASLDFQTKLVIEGAVSMSDRVIVLSHRPTGIRSVYEIELEGDRADMMAARESPGFSDYVRSIWADLELART